MPLPKNPLTTSPSEEGEWVDVPSQENEGQWVDVDEAPKERGLIGKAWDLANYPLPTLLPDKGREIFRQGLSWNPTRDAILRHGLGLNQQSTEGIQEGLADVGEGLITPLSLATMGSGSYLKTAAKTYPRLAPLVSGGLATLFGGTAVNSLLDKPRQLEAVKDDPKELARTLTQTAGDVGIAGLSFLGARRAIKEFPSRKPSSTVDTMKNNGTTIEEAPQFSSLDFYGSEINEPLPIPYEAQNLKGQYLVPPKSVKYGIQKLIDEIDLTQEGASERKAVLEKMLNAPTKVQREFLQQNNLETPSEGIRVDTPQFNKFDQGIEQMALADATIENAPAKVNRPSGVPLVSEELIMPRPPINVHEPLKSNLGAVQQATKRTIQYPEEVKTAQELALESNLPAEEAYKLQMKRPERDLEGRVSGSVTPTPEQLGPKVTPSSTLGDKLTSTPESQRLPIKYQEQYPGQQTYMNINENVVTAEVRSYLRQLGYTESDINSMSPEWANAIYNREITNPSIETQRVLDEGKRLKSASDITRKPGTSLYSGASALPEIGKQVKNTWKDVRDKFGSFVPQSVKELMKDKPFGLTIGQNGDASKQSVISRLPKFISKDELQALKDNGLDMFLNSTKGDKINVNDLNKWIMENGSRVEVKKLEANVDVGPEQQKLNQLKHKLDTLKPNWQHEAAEELWRDWPKEIQEPYIQFIELENKIKEFKQPNVDSATVNYQSVNPKPLDQMPGAVDILVRKPTTLTAEFKRQNNLGPNQEGENIQHKGQHFGSSDKNILGWTRGYMETLPNGDKVFHVFEVQSDWGQQLRDTLEKANKEPEGFVRESKLAEAKRLETPELNHYQSLALKAAIEHAHKNGAKYVALSDAETAMMTEGHDKAGGAVKPISIEATMQQYYGKGPSVESRMPVSFGPDWKHGKYAEFQGEIFRIDKPENNFWGRNKTEIAQALQPYMDKGGTYIPQEKGMRLNYDKILPDTLKKILGTEGHIVEFGEHQNSREDFANAFEPGQGAYKATRYNLIFKDPTGKPKTSISTRLYPLDKVASRLDTQEPFQIYGTLYSGIPLDAFGRAIKNTFKDIVSPEMRDKLSYLAEGIGDFANTRLNAGISQIRGVYGKTGDYLANSLDKFFHDQRENFGKYVNEPLQLIKDSNLKSNSRSRIMRYGWEQQNEVPHTLTLTPEEMNLYKNLKSFLKDVHDDQRKLGILVEGRRAALDNPNYWAGIKDPRVLDIITRKPESLEAKNLRKDWINHVVKRSKGKIDAKEASTLLSEYIKYLGAGETAANKFAAIRKAEGYGVPWSWQDKDLGRMFERYGRRVARDFSYYANLENDPVARGILGIADQFGSTKGNATKLPNGENIQGEIISHPSVQDTMRWVNQDFTRSDATLEAGGRAIKSVMLGLGTGVSNYIQNFNKAAPYLKPSQLHLYAKAHLNIQEGLKKALKQGVARVNPADISNPQLGYNLLADNLTRLSNLAYKYLGGNAAIENWTRAIDYNLGELATLSHLGDAMKGDKASIAVLDKLSEHAHTEDWRLEGKKGLNVSPEWLAKMASAFVEKVQETYDPRDLPTWTLNSKLSPFMSLSRWAFGASNTLFRDVVKPIQQGNYTPMLMYLGASGLTAVGVSTIREILGGKQQKDPTLTESIQAQNPKEIATAIVNLANMASIGGIVGDLTKMAWDLGVVGKTSTRGFTFPLVDFIANTMYERAAQAREAIANGEDPFKVIGAFVVKGIEENVQTLRILANHTWNKENAKHADKVRDYQVFKRLSGRRTDFSPPSYNPFEGSEIKKFKRSGLDDIDNIPSLAERAISRTVDRNIDNPYRLSSAMRGLKQNPITWAPSIDNDPQSFMEYYDWLVKTKGQKFADQFLEQYQTQKEINKAKSSMIPSINF